MLTLTMRPYGGEQDLEAIASLINACEAVDRLDQWTSVTELRQDFDAPQIDKTKDIRLWEDADGKLIGYSSIWIPAAGENIDGYLGFCVHPQARDGKIERQMIAWGEQRLGEVASEVDLRVNLRCGTRDTRSDRITLLQSCGFTADRCFLTMTRSLIEPIPQPQIPENFTLRPMQSEQDHAAWVEMFNQTFIDHWNHHPLTVEERQHWQADHNYKSELDLVAIAPDGTFAAFCYCYINAQENQHKKRNEGWIADLGTRRGFRRIGLGRAILLAGMHHLKAAGMDTAKLGVDADNPNHAKQLYESVGFRKLYGSISFFKQIWP